MRTAFVYIALLCFVAVAVGVFSASDAATRPEDPWVVIGIDQPVGEDTGYISEHAVPPPTLYAIECVRGDASIKLTYHGYPPGEFAVGKRVYILSGLRRWNRDVAGWRLSRVSYRFTPIHD